MRTQPVFLIGMPAVGKTTLGMQLAERLRSPFYDTDQLLEAKEGHSVGTLLATHGEVWFRRKEAGCLRTLVRTLGKGSVVATGGGLPCFHDNIVLMEAYGMTIWLSDTPQNIYNRHQKRHREKISVAQTEALFTQRAPYYAKARRRLALTDCTIDTSLHALYQLVVGTQNNSNA